MPDAVDIRISVEPAATEVRVDPGQLGQALTNLAVNGLRYSKEKTGHATLSIDGGIDPSTDRPYLNVIDDGPGVPEDRVDNLFEPFFTTERTGTGLGLYITREMCEANQARVTYTRDQRGRQLFPDHLRSPGSDHGVEPEGNDEQARIDC